MISVWRSSLSWALRFSEEQIALRDDVAGDEAGKQQQEHRRQQMNRAAGHDKRGSGSEGHGPGVDQPRAGNVESVNAPPDIIPAIRQAMIIWLLGATL